MRKIYLVLIMVVVTGLLIGCPSDPTGNGGGTTNPEKPVEQKPHIDYPDWNDNRVDDREEVLTPKDREELFSILDYQKKYEDKGWLAKSIDVNNVRIIDSRNQVALETEIEIFWLPQSFLSEKSSEYAQYINISNWDVSKTSNLSGLFFESKFNQDISSWDVSNVTDMRGMFADTWEFDQDISSWDVSNVTDMSLAFGWSYFNQDISQWNVSNVTDMSLMFAGAWEFNQDISSWDVSNVTNMFGMFADTWSFDQDLRSWDVTGKITTDMFTYSPMQFKVNKHPQGCLCGARWDDPRNTEYRDTYGEWSHDPDNPIIN